MTALGVDLGLGDGGAITHRFLRREILTRFPSPALHELEDAAQVSIGSSAISITTDSYIVDPPIFPGGDIGRLAVCGAVNDLIASGAAPCFMTMGLVLSIGFPLDSLRRILDSLAETAESVALEVVAGDTKVLISRDFGICINTTAVGTLVARDRHYALSDARIGDSIIVTGCVGDHTLAVLSQREGLGFEQRIKSDCAPLKDLILPLLQTGVGVHAMRDPTRAGVAGVLLDLVEAARADVWFRAASVPVRPETAFAAEMLGLDPLDLANEGKMVVVVAPDCESLALRILRNHPLGRDAAVIGQIRKAGTNGAQLICETQTGPKVVTRREGPPLPRIC